MERTRCFKRWLRPFQKFSWWSENFGRLEIAGEAASGTLSVSSATASLEGISVDGQSLFLATAAGERLKLMPAQSDWRCRAVWGEGGDQEVWHVVDEGGGFVGQACVGGDRSSTCVVAGGAAACSDAARAANAGTARSELGGDTVGGGAYDGGCVIDDSLAVGADGPGTAQAQLCEGRRELQRGHFVEAIQCFTAAAAAAVATADEAMARRGRAEAAVAVQDWEMAELDCTWCLENHPEDYETHQTIGLLRFVSRDYAAARVAYAQASRLAPQARQNAIWRGILEAERLPLIARPVAQCSNTFTATEYSLPQLWEFFLRCTEILKTEIPRNFAMLFPSALQQDSIAPLPYILTLPSGLSAADAAGLRAVAASDCGGARAGKGLHLPYKRRYPLLVYMHSAAMTGICHGDIVARQLQTAAEECPYSSLVERRQASVVDEFIGVAPCCPPSLADMSFLPKAYKKQKLFWFKACKADAYENWDFAQAKRVRALEWLVVEWLAHICTVLPVDAKRVHFVGASCGGYGVLRLAELVPRLPVSVVPMAGYYPQMPGEDHDAEQLLDRTMSIPMVWPLHCEQDKVCRLDSPHVAPVYRHLLAKRGVEPSWVPSAVAKGGNSSYHCAANAVHRAPDDFFKELLPLVREDAHDAPGYLRQRLDELVMTPGPAAATPLPAPTGWL